MDVQQCTTIHNLPFELISSIANHLDLQDFKAFRLTSRLIAQSTRSLLASEHFNGLLWRPDAARLYELSRIPECARRIRSVTFNFARLNEYKALHESFSHLSLAEPGLTSEMLHGKWEQYFETQRQMKALGGFRLDLVKKALGGLPSLKELTLTWTRCPWRRDTEPWRLFSADVSIRMAKREVFDVQDAVLRELRNAWVRLDTLNLEPIPLKGPAGELYPGGEAGFSSVDDGRTDILQVSGFDFFRGLRRLNLVLHRKSEDVLEEGLQAVLRQTALRELRLEYLPWERNHPCTLFLEGIYLPELNVLEVKGLEVGLRNLAVFLARHRRTLKKLSLRDMKGIPHTGEDGDMSGGSGDTEDMELWRVKGDSGIVRVDVETWEELFTMMRETLVELEDVEVRGGFTDPLTGRKCWFYCDHLGVPGDEWSVSALPLEKYLLDGGEMPELVFLREV
ncbi:F-box domain, cyclin-like protein [Pochonia chlamydosporia 170]|uniref:F-box domain, cyclin-like protein n=1 Tax=Pochonia chlamydosporia 170 TaxID=1380566 RepID=A0A179FCK9_METCM|nr:F-box domain, cyclin-like protein [Pochonia chlamydosporia 170]OAQ63222.1 F-box domain, cyclin-like protein [Pochonia chlamydosporia 170]